MCILINDIPEEGRRAKVQILRIRLFCLLKNTGKWILLQ
nr:MAG TPA: hypothetical protein [Caudoviricetes sp.]